jgi:hypothetical protein
MTEKITQSTVLDLWAPQFESVTRWLSHLQRKDMSAFALYRFCQWANKTPDEILEEKKKNPSANTIEKILDDFCHTEDARFTNSFKFQVSIAVKSFFKWNYIDYFAKASGLVILEKKKPYNKLTKESLRKLWSRALNLRDRALIPFVNCTAIAKETLSNLTWGHLEENWQNVDLPAINIESELLKGHGVGRYKGVRQITFLTPEAKRNLINYKEWIEQKLGRKVTASDHIWLDLREPFAPLTYDSFGTLISRLSRDASVKFSWHDGRRWVNTALEQISISPNWARKIRGRKVKGEEAPYSQPAIEQLREKFREAVPLLEFTSERPQVPKDVQERMAALETEQRELKRKYGLMRKGVSEPPKETKADCEDGEHCEEFKQIGEAELLAHLNAGWQVAYKLASGEVIVRRA